MPGQDQLFDRQGAAVSDPTIPVQALLLDLDGVLVDSLPVMREAWTAVRSKHRIDVPFAAYQQHLGRPFADIMHLLNLPNAEHLQETYDDAARANSDQVEICAGVEEVLQTFVARGWLLGVVTSKPRNRALPLLKRISLPFATLRTPGAERGKPAPDPLLLAVLDMGIDPRQAIYVGDMNVDQESARRAGLGYVHAGWGYGQPGPPPPALARNPADLPRLLLAHDTSPAASRIIQ
ncbi:HAD-IA family hydrolase [Micromonospora sp. NPDC085948]|uniref:HAD family hydrolase n=1 Tax=Micromonospora sp. NPDC085948 TaxID=3155293 RepID=UPI003449CB8F